jgi:hypothetical protein
MKKSGLHRLQFHTSVEQRRIHLLDSAIRRQRGKLPQEAHMIFLTVFGIRKQPGSHVVQDGDASEIIRHSSFEVPP